MRRGENNMTHPQEELETVKVGKPAKQFLVRREMSTGFAIVWRGYDESEAHAQCSAYQDMVRAKGAFVEVVTR